MTALGYITSTSWIHFLQAGTHTQHIYNFITFALIAEFNLAFHYFKNGSNQTLSSSCFHSRSCHLGSSCCSTCVSFYMAWFMITYRYLPLIVIWCSGSKGGSGSAVKKPLPKIPAKRPDRPDPKPKPTPKSPSKPTPKSPSQDPDDIRSKLSAPATSGSVTVTILNEVQSKMIDTKFSKPWSDTVTV